MGCNALSLDLVSRFRHQISKMRELGNGLLPEDIGEQLLRVINPLAESSSVGIDLYTQVLEVLTSHIV